jgi:hypothetical protein
MFRSNFRLLVDFPPPTSAVSGPEDPSVVFSLSKPIHASLFAMVPSCVSGVSGRQGLAPEI